MLVLYKRFWKFATVFLGERRAQSSPNIFIQYAAYNDVNLAKLIPAIKVPILSAKSANETHITGETSLIFPPITLSSTCQATEHDSVCYGISEKAKAVQQYQRSESKSIFLIDDNFHQ